MLGRRHPNVRNRTTPEGPLSISPKRTSCEACALRHRLKQKRRRPRSCFRASDREGDLACSRVRNGGAGGTMRIDQGTASSKTVTTHAAFLANVSRHFVSLEIDPMLESVGRSSLGVLGDVCTVDRVIDAHPCRILEVRIAPHAWMEAPLELAATVRGEVHLNGDRSRISVPIGMRSDRFGVLSFAKSDGAAHSAADLSLAQELGERLSLAIRNAREHMSMAAALGDRERLISIAAHELRNPLCSVRFCLQTLGRNGDALAPQAVRMLEIVSRGE